MRAEPDVRPARPTLCRKLEVNGGTELLIAVFNMFLKLSKIFSSIISFFQMK